MVEEPTIFMNHLEVEAILRSEKEKASVSSICLNLKVPYSADVAAMPYLTGYVVPHSKNLVVKRETLMEHVVSFLDSMGFFPRMLTFL